MRIWQRPLGADHRWKTQIGGEKWQATWHSAFRYAKRLTLCPPKRTLILSTELLHFMISTSDGNCCDDLSCLLLLFLSWSTGQDALVVGQPDPNIDADLVDVE